MEYKVFNPGDFRTAVVKISGAKHLHLIFESLVEN